MEEFIQENYVEPTDPDVVKRLPGEALAIHKRKYHNTSVVIFVHGLGGSRYGENSTWGNFPRYLFEDIPQLDVALYEYVTLLGRITNPAKSVNLSDEAEAFADTIRDLSYETVFLVGHSMGGLLCMAALSYLIMSQQKDVVSRVGGLILMATPQTGSQRAAGPMRWFSKDFEALEPHSEIVIDIHTTFVNHRVVIEEGRAQAGDLVIPTWAVLGTSDHWVDKLSAGFNIPASRRKNVRGSHTEIVKPATKTSDAYAYVHDRIKQVFIQQARR